MSIVHLRLERFRMCKMHEESCTCAPSLIISLTWEGDGFYLGIRQLPIPIVLNDLERHLSQQILVFNKMIECAPDQRW